MPPPRGVSPLENPASPIAPDRGGAAKHHCLRNAAYVESDGFMALGSRSVGEGEGDREDAGDCEGGVGMYVGEGDRRGELEP